MGLDMYLHAHKYAGDYERVSDDADRKAYKDVAEAVGINGFRCPGSPSLTVSVTVAYWRKANAVHQWFVDNAQDGEDDCKEYYVSREQLRELVELCQQTITSRDPSALKPKEGFFFGSTEVDDYYYQDLEETISQLVPLLDDGKFEGWEFYYRSSW